MGLQIGDIVSRREVSFAELKGKVFAVDAYNAIYQFLASVRQADGTPLMDSQDRITSHLSGLFYRNIALLSEGLKLIYVFDGEYHELKGATHKLRREAKEKQREKFEGARDEQDLDGMRKYAASSSRLTPEMVVECKLLLEALGVAVVQAPGEGEMQCAQLVKEGTAFAVASQDYDVLAVGGPRLVQNLTLARKRKTRTGFIYIAPELLEYEGVLNNLGLTADQLISLAILVGTDFNPGGVKGIGPKKALTLVKEKEFPIKIFGELEEQGRLEFDWKVIFNIFKEPNVDKDVVINVPKLNKDVVKQLLVDEHEFSLDRVNNQLAKLEVISKASAQKTLF